MNDAAQTRRCTGALGANHLLFRPPPDTSRKARSRRPATGCLRRTPTQRVPPSVLTSFLPTTSARRSIPKISNREPIRLEIHLTYRKQTIAHCSNRENNACFQITPSRPTRRPNLKTSNRESPQLKMHSNRENNACLSNQPPKAALGFARGPSRVGERVHLAPGLAVGFGFAGREKN
jgi:hypothetical protein